MWFFGCHNTRKSSVMPLRSPLSAFLKICENHYFGKPCTQNLKDIFEGHRWSKQGSKSKLLTNIFILDNRFCLKMSQNASVKNPFFAFFGIFGLFSPTIYLENRLFSAKMQFWKFSTIWSQYANKIQILRIFLSFGTFFWLFGVP